MDLDTLTDFEITPGGFQAGAKLTKGGLFVTVKRKMYMMGDEQTPPSWRWYIVSEVFVYFPTPKSDAMRIVGSHLALHDQNLPPTITAVWDLWDRFPAGQVAPPVQSKDMN
jgi:hypothetical protein